MRPLFLIAALAACARIDPRPPIAQAPLQDELSKVRRERDFYREQSAKAHELLTRDRHRFDHYARAEYLRGYIEGQAATSCEKVTHPFQGTTTLDKDLLHVGRETTDGLIKREDPGR